MTEKPAACPFCGRDLTVWDETVYTHPANECLVGSLKALDAEHGHAATRARAVLAKIEALESK